MWEIVLIGIGVLIGWNLPQPEYAKQVQANVAAKVRDWFK